MPRRWRRVIDIGNRYESEKIGKNYGSVSTAARLSKLSFPRYATSLATNAMRSPEPCSSHTPHGARHTHVSDHHRSSLDLLDLANSAPLPLAHHISIDLLAAMPPQRQRRGGGQSLLSAPNWSTPRARTSGLCPLQQLLSSMS